MMHVVFTDGRVLCVPLAWFPVLHAATPEQRAHYEIGGGAWACTGRTWTRISLSPA